MSEDEFRAAGWTRLPLTAFSAAIDPVWMRGQAGSRDVMMVSGEAVANGQVGNVHGGALMTFADIALGVAAVDAIGEPRTTTVQLQYSFAGGVRVGETVTCRPEVVRKTRRLVFTRGMLTVGERTIGSAEAIYNVFGD